MVTHIHVGALPQTMDYLRTATNQPITWAAHFQITTQRHDSTKQNDYNNYYDNYGAQLGLASITVVSHQYV